MAPLLHKAKLYNKKVVLVHKGEDPIHKISAALKSIVDEEVNLYAENIT